MEKRPKLTLVLKRPHVSDGEESNPGQLRTGSGGSSNKAKTAKKSLEASIPKRKRGRPSKDKAPFGTTQPPVFSISFYVEVPTQPILTRGKTAKGNKLVPQEPRKFGPRSIHQGTTWDSLKDAVATILQVSQDRLDFPSMTWRWSPGKSVALPLTDQDGFHAMVEQIKALKAGSAAIILLHIAEPVLHPTSTPVMILVDTAVQ